MRTRFIHFFRLLGYNLSQWGQILWRRLCTCSLSLYKKFKLDEVWFFTLFLCHRYSHKQFNPLHFSHNYRILTQLKGGEGLDATPSGELRLLKKRSQRALFRLKNALFLGAYQARLAKIVYFTFITLTLEFNNPFDRRWLMIFLQRKMGLLRRLLAKVDTLNGRGWNKKQVEIHVQLFYRSSLLQYEIIKHMHQACHQQKKKEILVDAQKAIEKGLYPLLVTSGASGSYWIRNTNKEVIGLFKPFDEEIHAPNNPIGPLYQGALGARRTRLGCRVGEAANHEVAAFVVDAFFGFGIVPRTYYASFTHHAFFMSREDRTKMRLSNKTKYGSFQEFVEGFIPVGSLPEVEWEKTIPLEEFQLLLVLDIIIGNTDRNLGNFLVGDEKLAAIDHGLCFPDTHGELSYWYFQVPYFGYQKIFPALHELVNDFPYEKLAPRLAERCFISDTSLHRMRERVALFAAALDADLLPHQFYGLFSEKDYLDPLRGYHTLLPEKAREQTTLYLEET